MRFRIAAPVVALVGLLLLLLLLLSGVVASSSLAVSPAPRTSKNTNVRILSFKLGRPAPALTAGRSVQLPNLRGTFVAEGYARLHKEGFRVSIPDGFVVDSLAGGGEILQTSPRAGHQATVGSAVSLTIGCRACLEASPAVPTQIPAYRVPNFVGEPLLAVTRWVDPKTLYLTEHFGRLEAAKAAQFAGNYRVSRQRPAPGTRLRLGIERKISANSGSFSPTPLTVWLTQTR